MEFEIVKTEKTKYVATNTRVQYKRSSETIVVNYRTEDLS